MVNHFPGMSEICRKDNLARNLNKMRRIFPSEYNFYPKTWWLSAEYQLYIIKFTNIHSYMDFVMHSRSRKSSIYIAKPDSASQGRGIFLLKNPLVPPYNLLINANTEDLVVQKYIPKTLLIDGFKFDLRVYVLVTSSDPLEIYVHEEGLARFATCLYEKPNAENLVILNLLSRR